MCNAACPNCNRHTPLRDHKRAYLTGKGLFGLLAGGSQSLDVSWRRAMPLLPQPTTQPGSSSVRQSRRGLGAVAGLGMLALASAVAALTPAERVAGLMASTSPTH